MATIDVPEALKVWKIGQDSADVLTWNSYTNNNGYNLFCKTNSQYLTWGKVPLGINLVFTKDSALMKTHFQVPDGQERPIRSGESVAFGIGGGEAFLRYAERDVGINLTWSKDPVFEWRIIGGELGTPIKENTFVALVNDKVKPAPDFLIYHERGPGQAPVGWTTSPQGFLKSALVLVDQHKLELAKMALTAL